MPVLPETIDISISQGNNINFLGSVISLLDGEKPITCHLQHQTCREIFIQNLGNTLHKKTVSNEVANSFLTLPAVFTTPQVLNHEPDTGLPIFKEGLTEEQIIKIIKLTDLLAGLTFVYLSPGMHTFYPGNFTYNKLVDFYPGWTEGNSISAPYYGVEGSKVIVYAGIPGELAFLDPIHFTLLLGQFRAAIHIAQIEGAYEIAFKDIEEEEVVQVMENGIRKDAKALLERVFKNTARFCLGPDDNAGRRFPVKEQHMTGIEMLARVNMMRDWSEPTKVRWSDHQKRTVNGHVLFHVWSTYRDTGINYVYGTGIEKQAEKKLNRESVVKFVRENRSKRLASKKG